MADKLPMSREVAIHNLKSMAIGGHYEFCQPQEDCNCRTRIRDSLNTLGVSDVEIGMID